MKRTRDRLVSLLVVLAVLALGLTGLAAARAHDTHPLDVTLEPFLVTPVTKDDGSVTERREPAETAWPGDVIEYRLTLTNATPEPLEPERLQVGGPVPSGTRLLSGWDDVDPAVARLEFSVDGGASFSPVPLPREARRPGERAEEVTFDPDLVTSLRWTVLQPLPGRASLVFVYRVVVR